MKIVIAAAQYSPSLGGVQTHAREVAKRLAATHDVTVLTSSPGGTLALHDVVDGVAVRRVPTWPAAGDPFVPRGWGRAIDDLQPDCVIVDGYQSVVSARALVGSIKRRIPTIVVYHEGANANRLRQTLYPLQRKVLGRWFRAADRTVATAPHEMALYQRELHLDPARLLYIPNGADLPQPSTKVVVDPWHLVSIGRLEPQKRHHVVIDALAALRAATEPWRLTIIGGGDHRDALLAQAKERGLADVVTIRRFGIDERAELAASLQSARLVVAPSLYETHPMAVIEAAALGCRVVVPEEGNEGVTGLAERGVAMAVSSDTPEALARSLRQALDQDFVVNRAELHTWDDCAATLADTIAAVLHERSATR